MEDLMQEERDVLTYTVAELINMLVERGGSTANFSFKKEDGTLIALIAIATMEDAYRLKNICKEYFEEA